jgi:sodium pump decarboxylase gamma subunit
MVAEWTDDTIQDAIDAYDEDDETEKVLIDGLEQFRDARDESGDYVGFYLDDNGDVKYSVTEKDDTVSVKTKAQFSKRDVSITYTFSESNQEIVIDTMLYEPQYSLGETMKKAALNTLIGIFTVVCVLVFLSILISLFKYVNKLENIKNIFKKNNKVEAEKEKVEEVDASVKNVDNEVDEMDDTELVAVITAAIAASSQNNVSTDGFVVRSIKRVSTRRW